MSVCVKYSSQHSLKASIIAIEAISEIIQKNNCSFRNCPMVHEGDKETALASDNLCKKRSIKYSAKKYICAVGLVQVEHDLASSTWKLRRNSSAICYSRLSEILD